MTAYYLGGFTVGECLPIAVTAKGGLDAALAVSLPEVQAKVAGALEAQAALSLDPPTLAGDLEAALALVGQLQAAVALGLPSAGIDLVGMAAVVAELQETLGGLQAQAALSASLAVTLGGGGVHLITQEGTLGTLGNDVASAAGAIGNGSSLCKAVVMIATTDAAWAGISAAMRVG